MNHDLELILAEICAIAHKHEVQRWLDYPGTDAEKLAKVLGLAREALALVRGGPVAGAPMK
jgi:hypothetical protein